MSRHSRIVQDLHYLTEQGIIQAFQRESYENEPSRVCWMISMDGPTSMYSTTEAEAFIAGAKKGLTILATTD